MIDVTSRRWPLSTAKVWNSLPPRGTSSINLCSMNYICVFVFWIVLVKQNYIQVLSTLFTNYLQRNVICKYIWVCVCVCMYKYVFIYCNTIQYYLSIKQTKRVQKTHSMHVCKHVECWAKFLNLGRHKKQLILILTLTLTLWQHTYDIILFYFIFFYLFYYFIIN